MNTVTMAAFAVQMNHMTFESRSFCYRNVELTVDF